MKQAGVPRRILRVRDFREYDPWDCSRYNVVEAVRVLRKWLADPSVLDELRAGDAELLAQLQAYLVERGDNRFTFVTRADIEAQSRGVRQTRH